MKITDFGIAKAVDAAPVTRSGMVMGTAHYIAPEQAGGGDAGPASDVYSLGVVGYECLAGRRPYLSENAVTVAMMHIRDPLPPLPNDVPPVVRQLIEATLAKDPRQRYATGGEFARAVAAVRRGEPLPLPGNGSAPTERVNPPTRVAPAMSREPSPPRGAGPSRPLGRPGPRSPVAADRGARWPRSRVVALLLVAGVFWVINSAETSPPPPPPTDRPRRRPRRPRRAPTTTTSSSRDHDESSAGNTACRSTPSSYLGRPARWRLGRACRTAGLEPEVRHRARRRRRTTRPRAACSTVSPTGEVPRGETVSVTCQEF